MSGLVSLLHRLVLGRQLSQKWPKARGRTWRMAVFVAEVEVEAGPLVVVRALGRGHPSPFQPPFKGYPCFSRNLLHRNGLADTAHPRAEVRDGRTSLWTAAS